MATIIAKKDLINGMGKRDFTKDHEYSTSLINGKITENCIIQKDDEGQVHRLGSWSKHFKIKK